jgi:hypothetical protein
MRKSLSLTVTIPMGYTDTPFAHEFESIISDYILSVDVIGDPLTSLDVDLYDKHTGNSLYPSSWTMDDYSLSLWFALPGGRDVHVEVLPKQTVVSVWE